MVTPAQRPFNGRPSLLACQECRSKHLKCDAKQPHCSRCLTNNLDCFYTPSRRGLCRQKRRRPDTPTSIDGTSIDGSRMLSTSTAQHPSYSDELVHTSEHVPPSVDREGFIALFYSIFHPSHPFLVPHEHFVAQSYPAHLRHVVRFVGSHYASIDSAESLRASAIESVALSPTRDVYLVQSLLLLAITLHARYEIHEAASYLTKAVDLAIELRMNQPDYALTNGELNPVLEESLRRTWWELYVVEGFFAALHQEKGFRCDRVESHPLLPCDKEEYASPHRITRANRLDDFENRYFVDDGRRFSSFCYRIETIRILSRVLAANGDVAVHRKEIQSIDNTIASWRLALPRDKTDTVHACGESDPQMVQAYTFLNCASIILHFPRSQLPLNLPSSTDIECARHSLQASPLSGQHATRALVASEQMTDMAALPLRIEHESPFFICGLVLGCVVQLSAYSAHVREKDAPCLQTHRDRVNLVLGALKTLARTWGVASHVLSQLRYVASSLFSPSGNSSESTSVAPSYDSGIDLGDEFMDLSWLDTFYNEALQHQTTL